MTDEEISKKIAAADADGDGKIDYKEPAAARTFASARAEERPFSMSLPR